MSTITIQNTAVINHSIGHRTNGNCKPIIAVEIDKTFNSCIDAADYFGCHVQSIYSVLKGNRPHLRMYERDENGKRARFIGPCRLMYAKNAEESVDALMSHGRHVMDELDKAKKKLAKQEAEMAEFRAWKAERERIRKAEEERQSAIAKAKEKVARRERMVQRKEEEYLHAVTRLDEAKMELNELVGKEE